MGKMGEQSGKSGQAVPNPAAPSSND
jgi:hypothetical protein